MANSAVFIVALCLGVACAEVFQSQAFESRLPAPSRFGSLDLSVKGSCDSLSCAVGHTGVVKFNYGSTGRGGELGVVYRDSGSVEFNTKATGTNPLLKTIISVGTGGAPDCHFEAQSGVVEFHKCGFHHYTDGASIGRTVVVKVRHQFKSGVNGVHHYGGKDIQVKIVLTKKDPETGLVETPVEVKKDNVEQCSALNHKINALNSTGSNQWTFEVIPENYNPDRLAVGFTLQQCVVKPYLKKENGGQVSTDPNHHFIIIDAGSFVGSSDQLISQTVVAGEYYKIVTKRLAVRGEYTTVDRNRPAVVSCSVCLCALPEIPSSGDREPKLQQCPGFLRTIPSAHSFLEENEQQMADLESGDVDVVPRPAFPF